MEIQEVFNELTDGYTESMMRWLPDYLEMLKSVLDALDPNLMPGKILDLGCGNGNLTQLVMNKFPKANYILLDASDQMLDTCHEKFQIYENVSFEQGYFQRCEYDNENFTLIVAALSIHHLTASEKTDLYKKIHNWLEPGGVFISTDLCIDKKDSQHSIFLEEWKQGAFLSGSDHQAWDELMEHYRLYDHPSSLIDHIRWLKDSGFVQYERTWNRSYWTTVRAIK